jgi:hypothetical protein
MNQGLAWAQRTFGDAELGDARRTRRLVKAAAGLIARPGGRVTRVFARSAEREGVFRLLENDAVDAAGIAAASHRATARCCSDKELVYVPVDETCLSFVDHTGTRFGRTGRDSTRRGMHAMNALAVDVQGTTLGTLSLQYWVQPQRRCPKWKRDKRPADQRQSSQWQRALDGSLQVMAEHAPQCTPWFQLDRGADCGLVLAWAYQQSAMLTVRATHNRAIDGRTKSYLWQRLKAAPVLGKLRVAVPARAQRPARIAMLSIRARRVRFRVAEPGQKRRSRWVELCAVYVSEPYCREGIEWMLWTTYPVCTVNDALRVVDGYTMRWRIEEFHKAWKSGDCDIESSQLRGTDAMQRWGAMTAPVAARAEHLKLLSRAEPQRPAETELGRNEIDAAIILSGTRKHKIGDALTLEQAVHLIASVGGYTGKSSGGPPGTITIARGLDRVVAAATAMSALKSG